MLLALAGAFALVLFAGVIVDRQDPLAPADAIYVLGGTRITRALEASELFHAGLAPRIVISNGGWEPAMTELAARGIHVTTEAESAREVLVDHLGVPAAAVELLPGSLDNTAAEARDVTDRGWTRLIVITDCATTRRAGYAFRRIMGPRVTVMARCARTDTYTPWTWWNSRGSARQTFYEFPKLVAYWIGLGG